MESTVGGSQLQPLADGAKEPDSGGDAGVHQPQQISALKVNGRGTHS